MKMLLLSTMLMLIPLFLLSQSSIVGDWKIEVPAEDGSVIPAKLSFDADGNYRVDMGMKGTPDVVGRYELSGSRVTLWDLSGEYSCPSEMKGVYEIEVTETVMRVAVVSDDCEGRRGSGKMAFARM